MNDINNYMCNTNCLPIYSFQLNKIESCVNVYKKYSDDLDKYFDYEVEEDTYKHKNFINSLIKYILKK